MPSQVNRNAQRKIGKLLEGEPTAQKLNMALRHLAMWRAHFLENLLQERSGDRILSGPFKGMAYPLRSSEGSRNPRLIGCYEACLAPVIEEIVAGGYDTVVDIGSAEGYYAVGLALRMPKARILARDSDDQAQSACTQLALANGVQDRVLVGGSVTHDELNRLITERTVVICDAEGAEEQLLDPAAAPALQRADILVEVHEGMKEGRLDLLVRRFTQTHEIRRIERKLDDQALPGWTDRLGDLDRLLLLWEWRSTPTPWLWMTQRRT